MKASRLSTISILFVGSLVLCATAFAAKTNKKTMHLYETSNKRDGYVLQPARNGGESIEEIFFSGAKYDLKIQPAGKTS